MAQEPIDVSGLWKGSSSFLSIPSQLKIELSQNGSQLSGYLYNRTMNLQDSAKKVINGVIKGNRLDLTEVDFVYRTGGFCLSSITLEITQEGNYRKLEGKWKGDLSWKTCAPGTAGSVLIYQEVPDPAVALTQASQVGTATAQQTTTQSLESQGSKSTVLVPDEQSNSTPVIPALDEMGEALVNELRQREYFALLIGIDTYKSRNITSLDNPISDSRKLSEVLIDKYQFGADKVVALENPNRAEIIDALDALAQRVTSRDNLLIFYAGHGIWDEQLKQGYWLPADATADSKSFWLSNSTIRDYLVGIKSKHTLLISDACFSGGILKERGISLSSRAMLELYKLPSRKAMTSGTMTTVPDKSVFMKYLLKNLEQNEYALLSAEQLFQQFKIAVIHNSPTGQVPQYGAISQTGDEGGDFIFLRSGF